MSTGGVIAIVLGVGAVIFLAVNRGLITAGVQVPVGVGGQRGIVAPQPAQNYGGYLAATTAPQVSSLLGTAISGLNNAFSSWLHPTTVAKPAPQQGANVSSPSMAAQPSGPSYVSASTNTFIAAEAANTPTPIGPVIDPNMSYNATPGSAFDYSGMAFDNGFDPNASLEAAGVYGA